MSNQSLQNKAAWEHKAYQWWIQATGPPEQAAADMIADPQKWVRRHLPMMAKSKVAAYSHHLAQMGVKRFHWRYSELMSQS